MNHRRRISFGWYDVLEHEFCTRDDRRAVVAHLHDETQRDVQDNFQEGSAVANVERGYLACTMVFRAQVSPER